MNTVLVALVAVVVAWLVKTAYDAGQFKVLTSKALQSCQYVDLGIGNEDFAVIEQAGVMIISSHDRSLWYHYGGDAEKLPNGALFLYNFKKKSGHELQLSGFPGSKFNPHGISLLNNKEYKQMQLFVINHPGKFESVEVFNVSLSPEVTLQYAYTIIHPELVSPNGVVAISPLSFYATNDHGTKKGTWMHLVEEYLQMSWSNVIFCSAPSINDPFSCRPVVQNMKYANGINQSPDGSKIYVATSIGKMIHIYDHDTSTHDLKMKAEVYTDSGCDNIQVTSDGTLYVACHPKLLSFVLYARNTTNTTAPSEVLRIRHPEKANAKTKPEQILIDRDGSTIPASSVAAVYDKSLVVGTVFAKGFWVCPLP